MHFEAAPKAQTPQRAWHPTTDLSLTAAPCRQVDVEVGQPRVNYREAITQRAPFDYLHKKQSGGQGQYGRVVGYIEPLAEDSQEKFEFSNEIVGNAIPPSFLPACR